MGDAAFYLIGLATVAVLCFVAILGAGFLLFIAALKWMPEFHWRAPKAEIVLNGYRSDYLDGEGRKIPIYSGVRVSRWLGISYRRNWYFGLLLFGEPTKAPTEPVKSQP